MLALENKREHLLFHRILRHKLIQLQIPERRIQFLIGKANVRLVRLPLKESSAWCFVNNLLRDSQFLCECIDILFVEMEKRLHICRTVSPLGGVAD